MTSPIILPQPVRLDAFRAGAVDVRGIDFTADLVGMSDTIKTVDLVQIVSRDDGLGLAAGDLRIVTPNPSPPYIDATNMIVAWWQTCDERLYLNGVTVDYRIAVHITTNNARQLICDAMQLVMPARG